MNQNICELDTMMFFDAALESQRAQLLTVMADAISECRTAADQSAGLNEDGEAGLLRLTEIWCAMQGTQGGIIFDGRQVRMLCHMVFKSYAYLLYCYLNEPLAHKHER